MIKSSSAKKAADDGIPGGPVVRINFTASGTGHPSLESHFVSHAKGAEKQLMMETNP